MNVRVTDDAQASLDQIEEYIAKFSAKAADRTVTSIVRRLRQIGEFPESGRIVPEFETRAVREVFSGPYRIWYIVRADEVEILAVIHGARDAE